MFIKNVVSVIIKTKKEELDRYNARLKDMFD